MDKKGDTISVILLLAVALVTGNELNLDLSHINKGFHVVEKSEAPSDALICRIMMRTRLPDFHPNRIECSVILSDRGQDALLNQVTIDMN